VRGRRRRLRGSGGGAFGLVVFPNPAPSRRCGAVATDLWISPCAAGVATVLGVRCGASVLGPDVDASSSPPATVWGC
jgi:hypothetical protein